MRPEHVVRNMKAYASRALQEGAGLEFWARHGRTRWRWKDVEVCQVLRCVVEEQGLPMTLWWCGAWAVRKSD